MNKEYQSSGAGWLSRGTAYLKHLHILFYPLSQPTLQYKVNSAQQYDLRDQTGNTATNPTGYILKSYPVMDWVYTLNYYDDYLYPGNPYTPSGITRLNYPVGMLTDAKKTVLNPDGTYGPMLWTVNYYDEKAMKPNCTTNTTSAELKISITMMRSARIIISLMN